MAASGFLVRDGGIVAGLEMDGMGTGMAMVLCADQFTSASLNHASRTSGG